MSESKAGNFIRDIIEADTKSARYAGRVATRFPPEPNGYLHIGHAKAMCIDFGLARESGGTCNLRFDDTNPITEDVEYVNAIQDDIRWLGFDWDSLHFASDYFEQCFEIACKLIEKGKAYVDSLTEDQIREYRGNYYKKGVESPFRNRPPAESLALFRRMRAGELKEGEAVLRAKIDLLSQNMNLRDPVLYRIRFAPHHRTGTTWCVYPLYDYAHPISDALEKITHSICTLEFEAHRPLYDWCIREAELYPSQQIEFARLALTYTVMSKRKLAELVQKGLVTGWDDPRMPTLAGLRRRGFTPEAIRAFCERIGVAKADSTVDVGLLEHCLRQDLEKRSPRVMGVVRPLRVVIDDFPDGETRELEAPFFPDDPAQGSRKIPFSRVLYVERDDFREDPPKDWLRLAPGRDVRLRWACVINCREVVKDAAGEVVELRCAADWSGAPKRVGVIHWVSAAHAARAEVRLYDRLFAVENPGATEGVSFIDEMNPHSLERVEQAWIEPSQAAPAVGTRVQFERLGYFCVDPDSAAGLPVWNRTVALKDTWAKIEKKAAPAAKAKGEPGAKIEEIGIDAVHKLDLRVGIVREATVVAEAQKLIRLQVDVGEVRLRQIFAGLRADYPDPSVLVGKAVMVVANLKPRQMKFGVSEGMVLAAPHAVATFDGTAQPGQKIL